MLDADWVISSTIFTRSAPRERTRLVPAVTVVADRPGEFELVLVIVDDWKYGLATKVVIVVVQHWP